VCNLGAPGHTLQGYGLETSSIDFLMKQKVSVIIADLDNTLFDWFEIWYNSFVAMLTSLVEKSGIPRETLEGEFKKVHQKHGTAEYSFSLQELPSLIKKHPDRDIPNIYAECIQAFRDARRSAMALYPTVLETLCVLRGKGCLLVGYTESKAFYSYYRIKKLGLDGILDYLYSPPDHDIPKHLDLETIRKYNPEQYKFRYTIHRHTPKGELKPSADLLKAIIEEVGADPLRTIYIGDNLMKDVAMAKDASITDVWAKYGVAHKDPRYELLRKVTHWTSADVEREKRLTHHELTPTYTLGNSFGEILHLFEFTEHVDNNVANLSETIRAWEKTVDVQQHFNDLCLRIRNYAIALLTAVLGVSALALKEGYGATVRGHYIPLASILLLLAIVPWFAFWFMDRCWYHQLLLGAVKNGLRIERSLEKRLPGIQLATQIGKSSPIHFWRLRIHASGKLNIFYITIVCFLVVSSLAVFYLQNSHVAAPVLEEEKKASEQAAVVEKIDVQISDDLVTLHLHVDSETERTHEGN